MSNRLVIWLVLVTSVLMLCACGGSGTSNTSSSGGATSTTVSGGAATGNTAKVDVKTFCTDYAQAANLLQYGITDSSVISDLKGAQASAPAAVKSNVTKILNAVEAANSAKSATVKDVTQESTQISNWAKSHC